MTVRVDALRRRALLTGLGVCAAWLPAQAHAQEPAAAGSGGFPSRFVSTSDGVRIHIVEQAPSGPLPGGDSSRARIVLVPGWCMPASIWRAQLLALGARWPTLAVDPRGQGESDVPETGYTADRRADDLHDVLAPYERVVLVGWSLGVLDALQYVHRHGSGKLLGLMLVDNSIGEPPVPKGSDFLERLRRDRVATVENFVRTMFARARPAAEILQLRDAALRMPLQASIDLLSYPLPREHWRELTHRLDRPLAYVVTPRFREQSRHLLAARPDARVEIFDDAGHALFVDEASRFNALLGDWVAGLA